MRISLLIVKVLDHYYLFLHWLDGAVICQNSDYLLFLLSLFMIIFSAIHIKNFRIDASSDTLVAKNDLDFIYFNEYNKLFTTENFLILAVKNNKEADQKFC